VAPVLLQGTLVTLQDGVDLVPDLVPFGDAEKERRVVDYHPASIDHPGHLGERLKIVSAARLPHGLAQFFGGLLPVLGTGEQPADFFLADARVPDLELSQLGELGHPSAVGGPTRPGGLATIGCVETVLSARHHEARGEAF
jgi:hypothetical protein